jgi:hypothetical protein
MVRCTIRSGLHNLRSSRKPAAGLTVLARGCVNVAVRKLLRPGLVLGKTIRLALGVTSSGFDLAVVKPRMARLKGHRSIVSRHGT